MPGENLTRIHGTEVRRAGQRSLSRHCMKHCAPDGVLGLSVAQPWLPSMTADRGEGKGMGLGCSPGLVLQAEGPSG